MIDYEKLTMDHRVQDTNGEWYDVHEIKEELDPLKRGYNMRPLITFRRVSDGKTLSVNREGYHMTAQAAELKPEAAASLVTPGAIKFKKTS